jgi:four helix bundle protein
MCQSRTTPMPKDNLEKFEVWQLANRLFHQVVEDVALLGRHPVCGRLVSQQIAAADSVCANIEEGYGRGSRKEFIQFLNYSRGSLREVIGRYGRMSHWIDLETNANREPLAREILAKIINTISTLRVIRGKTPPAT